MLMYGSDSGQGESVDFLRPSSSSMVICALTRVREPFTRKMRVRVVNSVLLCLVLVVASSHGLLSKLFGSTHDDYDASEEDNPCESVKVMPRIVGGSPVESETSTPYIAAVGEQLTNGSLAWYCGGSILSSKYILTAAHCLASRKTDVVRVGSLRLTKRASENDYAVAETITHPRYKPPKSYNDVAIIKLKDSINFADNIKPICLALKRPDKYENRKARVIGWGAEEVGGDGSQKLQKVEVEIVGNDHCDKAYQNSTISKRTFPDGVKDGQLCAGSPKGGKDACQGDSGGPLVLKDNEGVTRQIGIVSTGAGCGAKVYPGVYARVSAHHKWIKETMKDDIKSETAARPVFNESRQSGRIFNINFGLR